MNSTGQVYDKQFWESVGARKLSLEKRISDEEIKVILLQNRLSKQIEDSKARVIKWKKALEVVDHLIIRKAQLLEDAKKEEPNLGRL